MKSRFILIFLILAACIAGDQLSKRAAVLYLKDSGSKSFLDNTVQLIYAENTGSWGGFGSHFPNGVRVALLTVFPLVILAVVAAQLFSRKPVSNFNVTCLTLILAGGVGNLIDRVVHGYVVDFMYVGYKGIGTNIFNVADMALMAGMIGLFLMSMLQKQPKSETETQRTSA